MEEHPAILLLDEPENSLHIEWQQQLIDVIRTLNSNCQLIISTHSPSIFGDGWGDKLFFLEDMILK
jgi:predicted ATP-dependent endonuclease of OLD family